VRTGPRVLVVATVESTLAPTTDLVRSAAKNAGVTVRPSRLLVEEAWPYFEAGDTARYIETLAHAIRAKADAADVIVLAQASMAPVEDALAGIGVDVLSSPALGVRFALQVIDEQFQVSIQ
jgi:Asp/Glu/hydantoin racemase